MRRLMILVVLGLALAVGAEAGPKTAKPTNTPKPTITKTQTPKGGGAPKGSTVKGSTSKGSTVKATGVKPNASTGKSAKPVKSDTKLAKTTTKASKTDAKSAAVDQTKKTKSATSTSTSASTSGTSPATRTSTAPIDFTATSLGQKLQKNSAIRSKIEAKLQAAGYTGSIYEAAYGFKNLGQLNAATNQVQNQGYSFNLLKVLMTGTYVDPQTHVVYRANQLPDGTVRLVRSDLATNPASTESLGQAKQAIASGIEMPTVESVHTTGTSTTGGTSGVGVNSSTTTSPVGVNSSTTTSPVGGASSTSSTATTSKRKVQSKSK